MSSYCVLEFWEGGGGTTRSFELRNWLVAGVGGWERDTAGVPSCRDSGSYW